jgi:hypothetical protein
MSAEIIDFPKTVQDVQQDFQSRHRTGNGAREAVIHIAGFRPEDGDCELRADCFLAELWQLGFKIVPLDGNEG